MKESSTKMKDKIIWRRNKVQELSVKGFAQAEISRMLQISEPTISRDIEFFHLSSKLQKKYVMTVVLMIIVLKETK